MKKVELGKITAELLPDFENEYKRKSEGAFYTLENGEILFAYSRFKGKSNLDYATADICLLRSRDDGRTFQDEKVLFTCEEEDSVNIMSLSFLKMANGDIGLFYLVRTTYTQLQMFLRRSADGGRTWGKRILCTPPNSFYVVNNDRVIRLSSGRIIIPAARHVTVGEYFDGRSDTLFFYSDDDGETWKESNTKCSIADTKYCQSGLQEPGIIELYPGVLWGWARTDLGRQYEMFSFDDGDHWTSCEPSRFTGPCSPLSMKRGWDGSIYAIWNPIPEYNGREIGRKFFNAGRTPFVIAKSTDNGKTFSDPVIFEDDPEACYCYCGIHFTENAMLLVYCAGREQDGSGLARSVIRRVEKEKLDRVFDEEIK